MACAARTSGAFAGGVHIAVGTLQVGDGGSSGTLGSGAVTDDAALVFDRSDSAYVVSNTIGGSGSLTMAGSGVLTLSGANTYAGETAVAGGVLKLDADNALPATTVLRIGDATLGSGILDLNGHNLTLAGLYTGAEGPSHSAFWDEVTNTSATPATLTIVNSADYLYAGHFAGNLSLAKYGAGRFTVGGVSTNYGDVAAGLDRNLANCQQLSLLA